MFHQLLLISLCLFAVNASNITRSLEKGSGGCDQDCLSTTTCTGCAPRTSSKCYAVFCDVRVNWIGANNYCNYLGMRLAIVENNAQHNEVLRVIRNSACPQDTIFFWIGGSNLGGGGYVWIPTGQTVTYNAFLPGQPDNPGTEHCLEYRQGGWNNRDCNVAQPVICESVRECGK